MFKFCRIDNTNLVCYDTGLILRFHKRSKKWQVCKGSKNKEGYLQIGIDGKIRVCHRVLAHVFGILDLYSNLQIDHIDRIRNHNSISNLRVVTNQQNQFNRAVKGYSWNKREKIWKAFIRLDRKLIYLGRFDTEEEASKAYQDAKLIYHII